MDMRWIGIVLMGVFTLFWASWAFGAGVAVLTVIGVALMSAGVALLLAAVAILRRARAPRTPRGSGTGSRSNPSASDKRARSGFRILNLALIIEFVAIVIAVQIVRHIDVDLIQPVIALIVGTHFVLFWFSPATRNALHLWMTAAGVAIGVAAIVAILRDASPAVVHGWVGIAMSAITLTYGAVFVTLLRSEHKRPAPGSAVPEPADSAT